VRKTEVAESGDEKLVGGFFVMAFDYLWLALHSLQRSSVRKLSGWKGSFHHVENTILHHLNATATKS